MLDFILSPLYLRTCSVANPQIALDVISMGETEENEALLSKLVEAANKKENNW